jgi:ParB family chromosome partitioning protein
MSARARLEDGFEEVGAGGRRRRRAKRGAQRAGQVVALDGEVAVPVPVEMIKPSPFQARGPLDEESLGELAQTIRDHGGVLQPILVRPLAGGQFELVFGERRWRATKLAGLTHVSAMVRDIDQHESADLALIENLARDDLNPIEVAKALQQAIARRKLTQPEAGARYGISVDRVKNFVALLLLPERVQAMVADGRLSHGHGRALRGLDSARATELARAAVREGWSVRRLETEGRRNGTPAHRASAMPSDDAGRVRAARGADGAQPELFPDAGRPAGHSAVGEASAEATIHPPAAGMRFDDRGRAHSGGEEDEALAALIAPRFAGAREVRVSRDAERLVVDVRYVFDSEADLRQLAVPDAG